MNEQEMDKLITKMQGVFASAQDHVNLEEKVDAITEIVNSVKEDVSSIKKHLYDIPTKDDLATLEKEYNQMKIILKEKLQVEIGV